MQPGNQPSLPDRIVTLADSIQEPTCGDIRNRLIYLINELINYDFHGLTQLLYRIDVNEVKLKELLKENKETEAAPIVADMIIARQLQKIETRKQFKSNDNPPADERW